MKRFLCVLLLALLVLCLSQAALAEEWTEKFLGQPMPDLTVTATDGRTLTLSEVLKEKKLVVINFWATWCPPCKLEFPFMQTAYEQYQNDVEIIALTTEPNDTPDVIAKFVADRGLTFPFAQESQRSYSGQFPFTGIPTSIYVDRFGNVGLIETGSMVDTKQFTDLFDYFLADDYTETKPLQKAFAAETGRYAVLFLDENMVPIPGCVVNFCTDTACTPVESDAHGVALFVGPIQEYHVQVVEAPDEFLLEEGVEGTTPQEGGVMFCTLPRK